MLFKRMAIPLQATDLLRLQFVRAMRLCASRRLQMCDTLARRRMSPATIATTVATMACGLLFFGIPGIAAATAQDSTFFFPLLQAPSTIDYRSYTPGECIAAAIRTGTTARRTDAQQPDAWEARFAENDTVLAVQRSVAAACAKHFNVDNAPIEDLPDLARLYWFVGDSTSVHRAIARRITHDPSDSARAVTYRQLLSRFLLGEQRDITFATHYLLTPLNALASLGAQRARFQTHVALAHTFAASRHADANLVSQQHVDQAISEFAGMPAIVQATLVDTIGPLFKLGAAAATEIGDTARAKVLLVAARKLLPQLPKGAPYVNSAESIVRYYGMIAPKMHADFVMGAPEGTSSSSTWPRAGRWTLISPMPFSGTYKKLYQHIHQTFGDTLDIVFFMPTRGYWRPRGPLEPSDEAKLAYDYLSKRWDMPGVLLVEERGFRKLPDGRLIGEATSTPAIYQSNGILIDPSGTIRAMLNPSTIVRFDMLLTSLIRNPKAVADTRTGKE